MPPTSRANYFHSLRVHLQVNTWRRLGTYLDAEKFGFHMSNGDLIPNITDMPPAPSSLLKEVRCSCTKKEKLCLNCNCHKKRLPCSLHCKCKGNCPNGISIDISS